MLLIFQRHIKHLPVCSTASFVQECLWHKNASFKPYLMPCLSWTGMSFARHCHERVIMFRIIFLFYSPYRPHYTTCFRIKGFLSLYFRPTHQQFAVLPLHFLFCEILSPFTGCEWAVWVLCVCLEPWFIWFISIFIKMCYDVKEKKLRNQILYTQLST